MAVSEACALQKLRAFQAHTGTKSPESLRFMELMTQGLINAGNRHPEIVSYAESRGIAIKSEH